MYGIRHIVKGLFLWDAITGAGQTQEARTHKHSASIRQRVSLVSSLPLKIFLCVGGADPRRRHAAIRGRVCD